MKAIISIFVLFLFAFSPFARAQEEVQEVVAANSVDAIGSQVAALSNSVDSMNNRLSRVLNIDSTEYLVVDSSALEEAQNNPAILYNDAIGFSRHHKNSGWIWLRFIVSMFLLGSILFIGLRYCVETSLCRDEAYDVNGNIRPVKMRPFSYSRMQLFWWTMIILCCYTFFYGVTGTLAPLNPTAVILLGFGVIVLAGGKVIDKRQIKTAPPGTRNQDTDATKVAFLTDILSDDHGPSIHRFQAVVFNIVFGIGFVSYFITSLYTKRYPFIDFSEWQFALIGISSATYLGMKATENDPPVPPVPAQAPPAAAPPQPPAPSVTPAAPMPATEAIDVPK